jgi:hypothetical protein
MIAAILVTVSMLSRHSIRVSSSRKLFASASKCFLRSLFCSPEPSSTSVKSSSSPDSRVKKSIDWPNIARVLHFAITVLVIFEARVLAALRCKCSSHGQLGNDKIRLRSTY